MISRVIKIKRGTRTRRRMSQPFNLSSLNSSRLAVAVAVVVVVREIRDKAVRGTMEGNEGLHGWEGEGSFC